jgi:hypothetical protein
VFLDVPVYEVHGDHHEGLLLQPVGIAADFPFAKILLFDGLAAEVLSKDGLDFREAVKPGNEADAGDAFVNSAPQLIPNFAGQSSDFTSMCTCIYFHRAILPEKWEFHSTPLPLFGCRFKKLKVDACGQSMTCV